MVFAIINYVLIAGIAAVSVFGLVNGAGAGFSVFGDATGLILPSLTLAFALWRAFGTPGRKLGTHYLLWPVALVLLSRSLFADTELSGSHTALLIVSVLLAALVRAELVWGIVFIFAVGSCAVQLFIGQEALYAAGGVSQYQQLITLALTSLIAGAVPWLILKKRDAAQEAEFNKTIESVRNNAIADAMTRSRTMTTDKQSDTGAFPKDTVKISGSAASTDTIALLNVGGEGVNAQLKSMLFFMRYNFKALTASAFMYDAAKRVLVLNCYDTKGGIQIVDGAQIPFGAGVIGQVASDGKLFMSGDISLYQGSELLYYPQNQNHGIYSILAAPIIDPNTKEFLGVLAVDSINKNAFTEHDKELMRRFSIIASALIVNIRMTLSLEQVAKVFRVFYEVSHHFSSALNMNDIFNVLMAMVPKLIPSCTRQIVVLHDQEKNGLRLHLISGYKEELAEGMMFSPASGGIYSYAFNKNCAVNIPDLQTQRSYRFVPEERPNQTTRSLIIIPIIGGEARHCIGLFSVESNIAGLFKGEMEQHLTTIIENASVAITRALLYLKMEKLATTDGLTGLNNHRTFQEIMTRELERSKRYGHKMSLLLTDIDHFKSFNDTYGHPVGDLVLREIAGCIKTTVRLNDFPARYGGEEFAVVLPETDERGAVVIADRIRQVIEAHVVESGANKLKVTISIGVSTYPTLSQTQQEIIDCADKALYASKKGGRNRVTLYNPSMANVVG